MLRVDRCGNVVRDNRAPPTGTHNGDDDVAWEYGIALQLFVFLWRDEPALAPCELVVHSVIDSEYGDASVGKFRMKKLTAKRAGAYGVRVVCSKFVNSERWKPVASFTEHFEKRGGEERRAVQAGPARGGVVGVECRHVDRLAAALLRREGGCRDRRGDAATRTDEHQSLEQLQ